MVKYFSKNGIKATLKNELNLVLLHRGAGEAVGKTME